MTSPTDIAIIGMHGRFPGATGARELWRLLRSGTEAITEPSEEELLASGLPPESLADSAFVTSGRALSDIESFDAAFFGYSPHEAARTDPQQRLFLETCWQALEVAGYKPTDTEHHIGVFGGADMNTYLLFHLRGELDSARTVGDFGTVIGNDKDYLTSRVSYKLGLSGPSVTVQSACSTSLVAVHLACQNLLEEQCDLALAGGVSVTVPQVGYFFRDDGILSPDGRCKPFTKDSAGTVFGNGVGVVALKRLDDAQRDGDPVWAVVKGSAVNNDGQRKVGYTAPSIDGQVAVISEALAVADVEPSTVGYLEAHGTATPLGDAIEVAALREVFTDAPEQRVAFGSAKANVGHLGAAAGVTSLMKAVLAVHHGEMPPSPGEVEPNPELELERGPFRLVREAEPWSEGLRRAGVSSFGIGGTNAHVVVEQAPAVVRDPAVDSWQLVPFSARTRPDLTRFAESLADRLAEPDAPELSDVAHTLRQRNSECCHRRIVVCRDTAQAAGVLGGRLAGFDATGASGEQPPPVVFLLAGGGAQHPGMAAELYRSDTVFRQVLDRCAELFTAELGMDFRPSLLSEHDDEVAAGRLLEAGEGLPALFAVEYALAHALEALGIRPAALLGHSLGECVAACLAGVVSLPDAVQMVAARANVLATARTGAMLRIRLSAREVLPYLGDNCDLAVVNEVDAVVVSGEGAAIDALAGRLADADVKADRLHLHTAAHSRLLDSAVADFVDALRGITLHEPEIPFVSNLTGRWIESSQAVDPEYWGQQLRRTALFADGVAQALAVDDAVYIELGPGAMLSGLLRRHPDCPSGVKLVQCLPGAVEEAPSDAVFLTAVGRSWIHGVEVDWTALSAGTAQRVSLPPYQFQGKRHWIPPVGTAPTAAVPVADEDSGTGSTEEARDGITTPYTPPTTELEKVVARTWEEMLSIRPIGRFDSFFELGGDSLIATRVLGRLRTSLPIRLSLKELFATPTVEGVAKSLDTLLLEHVDSLSDEQAEQLLSAMDTLDSKEPDA